MGVKIIVDSSADLLPEDRARVGVVPLIVHFGQTEYTDGVTITAETFYQKLADCKELPHTSQASPFAFAEAFDEAVADGSCVVAIIASSELSGTYQSARIAAADYPGKVFVVDSQNIALSSGILAHYALQLADQGMAAEEIALRVDEAKSKVHLMAVVDTLEYLQRGGRVSKTAAIAGGLLAIKPIIGIVDGKIQMIGKARGNKQANLFMNREAEKLGIDLDMPILLGYTGTEDTLLQKYKEESSDFYGNRQPPSTIVSAVVGTHAGPGAVALAFFSK